MDLLGIYDSSVWLKHMNALSTVIYHVLGIQNSVRQILQAQSLMIICPGGLWGCFQSGHLSAILQANVDGFLCVLKVFLDISF